MAERLFTNLDNLALQISQYEKLSLKSNLNVQCNKTLRKITIEIESEIKTDP